MTDFSYITWHLEDGESLGNFKSYVTVGIWQESRDNEPNKLDGLLWRIRQL